MTKKIYCLSILVAVAMAFVSCNRSPIFSQYHHTQLTGWEKNDTLTFNVPRLSSDMKLKAVIGLRITDAYPFKTICLIVDKVVSPDNIIDSDTINCSLFDNDGMSKGRGVSCYQFNYHISNIQLMKDDSVAIHIRHNMKREILPGISDVGITLEKIQ